MWTLGRFLPLVVRHFIPENNEYWINYLRLLEIMSIVFGPVAEKNECLYLESLISDHHISLEMLYPNLHITPKLHYMTHIPRLMLQ